ncbi:MAG: YihY/virulence factor BrkB family protein [Clostridia bacterium]|nr:YihY/virulence factor BrkB family protein [Clostridia bacterium]
MKRILRLAAVAAGRVTEHKVSVYAAQATLFIIISALPFLMLMLSMLQYVIPHSQRDLLEIGGRFLPSAVIPFLSNLLDEIYTGDGIPIMSVTSAAALWSASKGVMSLLMGLDNIYSRNVERGYIKTRLLSLLYTVILILMLSATLLLFVASKYLVHVSSEGLPVIRQTAGFFLRFPTLVYLALLTAVFALLYRMLPGQKISFGRLLPGAFFSACGWVVFSLTYSFYVDNFTNYSFIYGSLTAIVLLMLWLYFCMNIFLWGAEINEFLQEKGDT